jgi:hypothetical protein
MDHGTARATIDETVLTSVINALNECAYACAIDIDEDLAELGIGNVEMERCVRLCLNCADICTTAAGVLRRRAVLEVDVSIPLLDSCLAICISCGDECQIHAPMHEHCRLCGESCRRCEEACRTLLTAMK